ncbi:MAG: GH32 C-terminal domain-containing protein, partial [Atopobiaceae bacterium]|nr:GH32 C-terminal domain-containing protein [Atopobiaceae bacterium]
VYQSGYFVLHGDVLGECSLQPFALWDAGFDFYAPQTFLTDDGRRVLIGWMGMPDEKTYTNLTVEDGWQHCFTVPRTVTARWGRVLQWPVRELEAYRGERLWAPEAISADDVKTFDLVVYGKTAFKSLKALISDELELSWDGERFEMRFLDTDKSAVGAGRTSRFEPLDALRNLRVVADVSSVEVFVNDGELTFSTRYYPKHYGVSVEAPGCEMALWELKF